MSSIRDERSSVHTDSVSTRGGVEAGPSRRRVRRALTAVMVALVVAGQGGCAADTGTQPGSLRFGQEGGVQVHVLTPVWADSGAVGALEQTLSWRSSGEWRLVESISYRGVVGDSTVVLSGSDARTYAASYASLITLVNESEGVKLLVDGLDPTLVPDCGSARSTVSFRIQDQSRDTTVEWTRCANGSLGQMTVNGSWPPNTMASRVVQAAQLARDYTVGQDFVSAYAGTVPFATLARMEDPKAGTPFPTIFVSADGQPPAGWTDFWSTEVGTDAPPLPVDWSKEMVVVATVGQVNSAGHEVEVRRILPVDQGTRIEVYHRIPGDFCSPAGGVHTPFHVVVAPRTTLPVRFNDQVFTELVPCGI